jgi:hypothetical protein
MTRSMAVVDEAVLEKTVQRCRERGILIPTLAEQKDPTRIPEPVTRRLGAIGLWDVDPLNLFRITWKNEPVERGGLFNRGNWIEFPPELTGVPARIVGILGHYFPTGAHKVGAAASGVWCPGWCAARSTRRRRKRFGRARATTVAAGRSIARCSLARRWRSCRKR